MVLFPFLYHSSFLATLLGFEVSNLNKEFNNFITSPFKGKYGTSSDIGVSDDTPCPGFHISALAFKGSEDNNSSGSHVIYV